MDNSMATRPRSKLKGDPYRAFEALPLEVRRAMQEALVDWCPLRARELHLELLGRAKLRPAQAADYLVQTIRRVDQAEVAAFARTWPNGAAAYPHLAAGATLQRYAGPEGIPAAKPVVVASPAPQPPKKPQAKAAPPKPSARKAARPKLARPKAARPKAQPRRAAGRRARR